ncbi:MAG: sugar-transfer associated ATP-grasp domain-containing protein, partial [Pseudomonadota bacterium]
AQPRLHPHADLAALTAPAATVLRVNSALLKTGGTEIVSAYLSLHPAGSFVASPAERTERGIDFASGETLPSQSVLAPRWTGSESPDGRPIPHWSELCSLVRKAHAAFPGSPVLLGWDVAVTDDGPVLIEVNTRVGFGLHQRATGQPACAGRWGIILDEWLKAKF